ncbi:MAG: hypothetical protein R6U61_05800 [Thermoplasmata archaeon]
MDLERLKSGTTVVFVFLLLMGSYSLYIITDNTDQYTRILETEAHFSMRVIDLDVESAGDDLVYLNTTLQVWNNGTTELVLTRIEYSVYLNVYALNNWVGSEGSYLYLIGGNVEVPPGESRVFQMDPMVVNVTESDPIRNNMKDPQARWLWILTSGRAAMFCPEFDEEGWSYSTRIKFQGSTFNEPLGGGGHG